MKRIVVLVAVALGMALFLGSYACAQSCRQATRPGCGPELRREQARDHAATSAAVNVRVPVPWHTQAVPCPVPQTSCVPQAGHPARVPVRVEVSVKADPTCPYPALPVAIRDPGPFKPVLFHTVGLVGSAVAAPFRVLDTVADWYEWRNATCAQGLPPVCPPNHPRPPAPCGPPPCFNAYACPPGGPEVAPYPRARHPEPCRPSLPPRVVREAMLPPVEPQSFLFGLVRLPGRLIRDGRLTGDLLEYSTNGGQ
jgi:hypothetical protein